MIILITGIAGLIGSKFGDWFIEKLDKKSKIWKMIQGKELKVFGKKIHSQM